MQNFDRDVRDTETEMRNEVGGVVMMWANGMISLATRDRMIDESIQADNVIKACNKLVESGKLTAEEGYRASERLIEGIDHDDENIYTDKHYDEDEEYAKEYANRYRRVYHDEDNNSFWVIDGKVHYL